MTKEKLIVANETKGKLPRLPLSLIKKIKKIKEKILGKNYLLNVIFIGDSRSKKLNKTYRKKNNPTNILSFQIEKNVGEIYINRKQIEREVKIFNRDFDNLLIFLLIHGMFHLKGELHGSRMESKEKTARALFNI